MAPMKILPFSVLVWSCLFIYVCNGRDESKRFILDTLFHWGQWGDYTQCTDCIKGSKSRQRYCYDGYNKQIHGTNCGGYAIELLPCSQSECGNTACVDTFSPCLRSYCTDFTDWSQISCKKTCGFCTVVSSVNGNWSPWSRFTACSHSCGTGTATRNRYCNNPAPSGNGYGCYGNGYETKTCNTVACSVDGGWSRWDPWSSCTTSCGLGVISRDRTCTNPSPVGNGAPCSGDHTEKHECSVGPCAEWSHWFEGDCSMSCGNGTMERLRHCSTGRDTDCVGESYEMVPCSNVECI